MKKILSLVLVFMSLSLAASAQNFIVIPKQSNKDLEDRIYFLERAVYELQQKVYDLQRQPQPGVTPGPTATPLKNDFFCKLSVFGKTYKAFAPTKAEAREQVREQCEKNNSSVNCDTIDCEKNK
jgi:hypothetical protein